MQSHFGDFASQWEEQALSTQSFCAAGLQHGVANTLLY